MVIKQLIYTSIFAFFFSYIHTSQASFGFMKIFIAHKHENCPKALRTDHKSFCSSFKVVAECHCTSSGAPKSMCKDMASLYNRMISVFETQQSACNYQQDTHPQNCMDSWNCYRLGGKDSRGRSCSSTGRACQLSA
jgi:hypothetical protein